MSIVSTTLRETLRRKGGELATFMDKRPVLANSILGFNLWVAGDLLAQSYEHENEPLNYKRTLQAASYGGFFTGPLYALWFPFLDRQCVAWKIASRFTSGWAVPMVKVAADEIVMDPPSIVMFFTYMEFWHNQGKFDYQATKSKIISEFPRAWATSLVVWPAILLVTFRYVPLFAQSVVVNVCAIVWDGFLSHRNALADQQMLLSAQHGAAATVANDNDDAVGLQKRGTHRLSVQLAPSVTKASEEKMAWQASKDD